MGEVFLEIQFGMRVDVVTCRNEVRSSTVDVGHDVGFQFGNLFEVQGHAARLPIARWAGIALRREKALRNAESPRVGPYRDAHGAHPTVRLPVDRHRRGMTIRVPPWIGRVMPLHLLGSMHAKERVGQVIAKTHTTPYCQ